MAHSRAKLRASVTGEPHSLAAAWIADHGLADGLVPDAQLPAQQLAEAALLITLARPQGLPVLSPAGTLYGLAGTEPSIDRLTLRPSGGHAAAVLARLLPAHSGDRLTGVPLLRTGKITKTCVGLRLSAVSGMDAVHLAIRATRAHRRQAEQLQGEVGLTPLWTSPEATDAELRAWRDLARTLAASMDRWSQALRRPALFVSAHPDWSTSTPAEHDVTTSVELSRLAPPSVAPRRGGSPRRAPIVAVSAAGGGDGGTTVALGAAAALARQGLNTAVLLEPGALDDRLDEHVTETTGHWAVLESPAAGRLEATTRDDRTLRQQLRAAQARADVVVVDPTSHFARGVPLPVDPDVSLMLLPHKTMGGTWLWREHQTLDRRPAEVRMAAWLSHRFESFTRHYLRVHPPTRSEELLQLLHERFAIAAMERSRMTPAEYAESGGLYSALVDDTEYAESDALYTDLVDDEEPEDLLELWWTPNSPEFQCEPNDTLPPERDAPIDSWRKQFLRQLEPEGRQRFGAVWDSVAAAWPASSRARNQLRLHPTAPDPEKMRQMHRAFLHDVATEAAEQWGELWPEQGRIWADAAQSGQDLTAGWERDIEIRIVPRTPDAVIADLASVLAKAAVDPSGTVLLVRNQVRPEDGGSAEQLHAVSAALSQAGVGEALCEIPSYIGIRENAGNALLTPAPALAEAFDKLAALISRSSHTPPTQASASSASSPSAEEESA